MEDQRVTFILVLFGGIALFATLIVAWDLIARHVNRRAKRGSRS